MTGMRRVWTYYRTGHGTYIAFFLTLSNFILIAYSFVPSIREVISLPVFLTVFVFIYVPLAIIVGYFHYKTQLPIEQAMSAVRSPYRDKLLGGKEELSLQHHVIQMDHHIRSMRLMNEIATKLGIDPGFLHTDEEFKSLETMRQRLYLLLQHEKASIIMRSFPLDNNDRDNNSNNDEDDGDDGTKKLVRKNNTLISDN